MKKLFKMEDEKVYYHVDEEVYLDWDLIAIVGNDYFEEFGNQTAIDIIKNDYYDNDNGYEYETFDELKKITSKKWNVTTIKGYSQSDWQRVYYVEDEITKENLKELENFYMGKISGFIDEEDCVYLIPNDVVWDGKTAICEYLGFEKKTTKIYEIKDQKIVYDYKEMK